MSNKRDRIAAPRAVPTPDRVWLHAVDAENAVERRVSGEERSSWVKVAPGKSWRGKAGDWLVVVEMRADGSRPVLEVAQVLRREGPSSADVVVLRVANPGYSLADCGIARLPQGGIRRLTAGEVDRIRELFYL